MPTWVGVIGHVQDTISCEVFFTEAKKIVFRFLVHPRIETMGDDVIIGAEVVVTFIHITF